VLADFELVAGDGDCAAAGGAAVWLSCARESAAARSRMQLIANNLVIPKPRKRKN